MSQPSNRSSLSSDPTFLLILFPTTHLYESCICQSGLFIILERHFEALVYILLLPRSPSFPPPPPEILPFLSRTSSNITSRVILCVITIARNDSSLIGTRSAALICIIHMACATQYLVQKFFTVLLFLSYQSPKRQRLYLQLYAYSMGTVFNKYESMFQNFKKYLRILWFILPSKFFNLLENSKSIIASPRSWSRKQDFDAFPERMGKA